MHKRAKLAKFVGEDTTRSANKPVKPVQQLSSLSAPIVLKGGEGEGEEGRINK
jgi:hypothetical protein